jgi:hypothetical protein
MDPNPSFLSNLSGSRGWIAPVRSGKRLAPRGARRLLASSDRLRQLVWPSTERVLLRRRDGAIAVDTMYRALTGRIPTPPERAEVLRRTKAGLGFDALVDEIQSSRPGVERTLSWAPQSVRRLMEQEGERLGGPAGAAMPRIVFLHIMKTGGTSLSDLLEQWAGPAGARVGIPLDDLAVMPRPQLARLRAVSGHIPYEALSLIPASFRTVTVLRDPVSRTVSHYRELRRSSASHRDLSLDEFLHDDVYDVPSGNYQARALAHTIDLPGAWVDYSPERRYREAGGDPDQDYPLQALFDSTPLLVEDNQLFETAARNLSKLDFVGVTADLASLAARIGALFGARPVAVPRLNTSEALEHVDVPAPLRRRIEERTAVDRELYDVAVRLSQP